MDSSPDDLRAVFDHVMGLPLGTFDEYMSLPPCTIGESTVLAFGGHSQQALPDTQEMQVAFHDMNDLIYGEFDEEPVMINEPTCSISSAVGKAQAMDVDAQISLDAQASLVDAQTLPNRSELDEAMAEAQAAIDAARFVPQTTVDASHIALLNAAQWASAPPSNEFMHKPTRGRAHKPTRGRARGAHKAHAPRGCDIGAHVCQQNSRLRDETLREKFGLGSDWPQNVSTKDLNQFIRDQGLTPKETIELKKLRRRIKNRGYAQHSRERRARAQAEALVARHIAQQYAVNMELV